MILLPNLISVSFFLVLTFQNILTSEMFFDRIELLNASYVKDLYNVSIFRVNKFNRTTYVFNMEFETYTGYEMNDKIQLELKFYYNRFNNNQYTKSLIRIPKDSICKTVDKYGPILGIDKNVTNLPFPRKTGEHFCPASKVNFSFLIPFVSP